MTSDSTPPVSGASLNDQLAGLLVDSRFPEATVCQFLPHGSIEQLIGRASIIDELFLDESRGDNRSQVPAGSQDDALVDFILHSAKKIFTICLMSHLKLEELRTAMERFSKHSFTDEKLPVDFESKPPPFSIDKLWTASRINEFKVKQWRVLAPVFPKEFVRLELSERHVLPFTNVDSERKEGTFGAVDGTRSNVAIKELKAYAGGQGENAHQIYEEWQAEAKALEETSRLDHSHIVPVKAIITKGQRNYFMFQWADGGSLRDLFQRKPKPVLTRGLVEDIAVQLTGIADALSALHNFQNNGAYRHGDLKPENILIFGNGKRIGLWTIADMGLAKCHYVSTGLRGPTSTRYATPSYEPPEVRTDPTAARSRLYDIWSMGCIVLELIIWLLYDCDDLDRFNRSLSGDDGSRGPYWVYHRRMNIAEVSPKVKKIIKYIRDDLSGTSSAMEDLLRIVENDLLVVALPALSRRQTGIGRSLADLQSPRGSNVLQQGRGNPSVVVSYAEDRDKSASSQTAAGPHRASANELCKALKDILKKGKEYELLMASEGGEPYI
ncbi:hypothetical protein N0V93_008173 [Gnomoniopsis smithogilvyi]|uniref:Protein kinase domain-containing protein n=1 Tax=Gnomoniopsis smithogilvyi TaxID=1191159 RepID=A0A9W8YNN0_9PEZI|nr:hypothetical protein N0V93_008173 [Gnomoniopsis smithogilvyi]